MGRGKARRLIGGPRSTLNSGASRLGPSPSSHLTPGALRRRREAKFKEKVHGIVRASLTAPPHERTDAQIELLTTESQMMPAFAMLSRGQLKTLWGFLVYRRFVPNARLFEQGQEADKFYVVWSGQVSARIQTSLDPMGGGGRRMSDFLRNSSGVVSEMTVGVMNIGDTLGEAAATGGIRKAACVTESATELLVLNRHSFEKTFKVFFEKKDRDKTVFLKSIPFFKHFTEDEILREAHFCREVEYRAGQTIVSQGDDADCMYFITSGLVSVVRSLNHSTPEGVATIASVSLTKLCTGAFFGENAVVDYDVYPFHPSSIICETTVKVLRLSRETMSEGPWGREEVVAAVRGAAYRYADDNVLLQTHVDLTRNQRRKKKAMKSIEKTLLKRGRKDQGVMT